MSDGQIRAARRVRSRGRSDSSWSRESRVTESRALGVTRSLRTLYPAAVPLQCSPAAWPKPPDWPVDRIALPVPVLSLLRLSAASDRYRTSTRASAAAAASPPAADSADSACPEIETRSRHAVRPEAWAGLQLSLGLGG